VGISSRLFCEDWPHPGTQLGIKASGVVVQVTPADFYAILRKVERPLVIFAKGGFFSTNYQYLVSYKGFAFFTKSSEPLLLPSEIDTMPHTELLEHVASVLLDGLLADDEELGDFPGAAAPPGVVCGKLPPIPADNRANAKLSL